MEEQMKNVKKLLCTLVLVILGIILFGGTQYAEAASIQKQFNKLTTTQKKILKDKIESIVAYDTWYDTDGWEFYLVYINDDDIPEIWFNGADPYYEGVLYFKGNSIEEFSEEGKYSSLSYIPRSGLISYSFEDPHFDDSFEFCVYSFPDFKEKTEKDYEKALKKYDHVSDSECLSYYDMMAYLGYPELAYDAYTEADLDGDGKKETIGIRAVRDENSSNMYYGYSKVSNIFINNQSKYAAYNNWAYEGGVYLSIIDINPADSYKEISVEYFDPHGLSEYAVFRYKNKKLKLLFDEPYIINTKNNDSITILKLSYSRLGYTYVKVDCKIKKNGLKEIKKKGVFNLSYANYFTAAENIKVYAKTDKKKIVTTIKVGEGFTVTKLKKLYNKESKEYTWQYAYVETAKGGFKGWINIEGTAYKGDSGENLVMIPNWLD